MSPPLDAWLVDLHGADLGRHDGVFERDLSGEELLRASRFRYHSSASTFLRSRSIVRRLLARVLGERPATIGIQRGPHGKPVLSEHPDLHVSWSRTGRTLLVGIGHGVPVGVDVERVRPVASATRVLESVYPMAIALGGMDDDPEGFLSAWTLLEAAVKATGRGLAAGAREVDLDRPPGEHCVLRAIRGPHTGPWSGTTRALAGPVPGERVMTAFVNRGVNTPVRMHGACGSDLSELTRVGS